MEYISLDEEDFRCLVRGGVIMYDAIADAQTGIAEIYKDHIKEK